MIQKSNDSILVWSQRYQIDLNAYGIQKPFAVDRALTVLNKLGEEQSKPVAYSEPDSATREDLLLVHTPQYLSTLENSETWKEIFELKSNEYFPERATRPLADLYKDIKLQTGGTMLAVDIALKSGLSANLGGGFHHAYPDKGTGFCAMNDVAIAIRSAQRRKLVERVLIVDLDFHQGDGTAVIFAGDKNVFTLSVHSQEGWPEEKQKSDLDVGILSAEQHLYIEKTAQALDKALSLFDPQLVIYLAGSDPYELCALPGSHFIKLPLAEMRKRDEMVLDLFHKRKTPLAMVFAGGYGAHVWEVHYFAVRHMLSLAGLYQPVAAKA